MTLFQYCTVFPLSLLAVWELVNCLRRSDRRALRMLRMATWIAAAVTIADPSVVTHAATATGINRGADLVLYSFVLFGLMAVFYFYTRQLNLQRQITELVRHGAMREARRGGIHPQPGSEDTSGHSDGGSA